MMVVITYDVNTETKAGRKRLAQVAKECENYGQRVQNSVFECLLDPALLKILQIKLGDIIDVERDSIRYYYLGDEYKTRIVHVGVKKGLDLEGTLIA